MKTKIDWCSSPEIKKTNIKHLTRTVPNREEKKRIDLRKEMLWTDEFN
jgi:hypothetical protein